MLCDTLDMSPKIFNNIAEGGLGEGVMPIKWTVSHSSSCVHRTSLTVREYPLNVQFTD